MSVNIDLRRMARAEGVPLWRIAQEMGVSEPTITRWLRKELPNSERQKFIAAIEKHADKRGRP